MNTRILLLAVVAALLISAAFVRADEYENQRKAVKTRSLEDIDQKDDSFRIRSKSKEDGAKSQIEFQFKVDNYPRFNLRYDYKDNQGNATKLRNRWSVLRLIEYNATTTQGLGTSDTTTYTVVNAVSLTESSNNFKWGKMVYTPSTVNGVQVYNACSTAQPVSTNSNFKVTVCAVISASYVSLGNAGFADPDGFKWSVAVSNFPFKGSNTRIALKTSFTSVNKVKSRTSSGSSTGFRNVLDIDADSYGGVVAAWNPTVAIAGTGCAASADVAVSQIYATRPNYDTDDSVGSDSDDMPSNSQKNWVYYSFLPGNDCRPTSITWDPQLAFSTSTSAAFGAAPTILLVAVLAVLAAIFA